MEKIIGGKEFKTSRPLQVSHKLLWPCYEFIVEVEGLDGYNRNIIEEVVLKLAAIGVVEPAMVEQCTGMDRDLISFVHSRLQQRGMLDDFCRVTEVGQNRIESSSKRVPESIRIYVDALSGKVIPYYSRLGEDNGLRFYSFEEEASGTVRYELVSSAGTEGKELPAYRLHYNQEKEDAPDGDDVAEMLHKLHPQKDIVVKHGKNEGGICYILLDIVLYEGDSEQWGFSDGFGNHSLFFSREKIRAAKDNEFITGLRESLHKDTNASAPQGDAASSGPFPKVQEKFQSVKTNLADWEERPNSPDQEEKSRKARNGCIVSLVQLMEWTLYHLLHSNECQVGNALAALDRQCEKQEDARCMIGRRAALAGERLGFKLPKEVANCLNERYGRIKSAWEGRPTLFALIVLLLISLENEEWLQVFAQCHSEFICRLAELNRLRNESAHAGDVAAEKAFAEKICGDIHSFMEAGLQVEIMEKEACLSCKEKFRRENKRQAALSAAERALGFSLYDSLEPGLRNLVVDMEGCCGDDGSCDNAIVLEQYKLLENILVLANRSLGNEEQNLDWKAKAKEVGLGKAESVESLASLAGTNEERIKKALERRPSSMTAACIAFLTLARKELLLEIRRVWPDFLPDIDYLAGQRGHGEIPEEVDNGRVLRIKGKIIELIKFLAGEGFLTVN